MKYVVNLEKAYREKEKTQEDYYGQCEIADRMQTLMEKLVSEYGDETKIGYQYKAF